MRLPDPDLAVIDPRKVVDYLLNTAHPDNGGKAAFFESLGFQRSAPDSLIEALRAVAHGEVHTKVTSGHGDKYVIDSTFGVAGRQDWTCTDRMDRRFRSRPGPLRDGVS